MDFIMSHLLSLLVGIPLAGILIIMLTSEEKVQRIRWIATIVGFLNFLISLYVFIDYSRAASGFKFVEDISWVPQFGISYKLGIDGISAPMVLLSGILMLTCVLVSWNIKERVREYFALTLATLTGVYGIFVSLDLFFFILFYELASIPMYFLIGVWGSDKKGNGKVVNRQYAAVKLILYLQLGGGLILLGILGIFFKSGVHTFDFTQLLVNPVARNIQMILFPVLFIGLGIEAGLWPLHTWLPDGHSAAPTALSMILAGVLLKMGGYGIIRLAVQLMPDGAQAWLPFFSIIAVINILYGALCALKQTDLKYMIAYSSVSHMGIVFLGIGAMNVIGLNGAVFQMLSHGIITALLFAMAGYIYEKTHTRIMTEHGGLGIKMPYLAVIFALGGLGTLGLPAMSGFIAEVLVLIGAFRTYPVLSILAILGLVITATYVLKAVQRIFMGPLNPVYESIPDATGVEKVPIAILAFFMILFGILPSLVINVMNSTSQEIITLLGKFGGY